MQPRLTSSRDIDSLAKWLSARNLPIPKSDLYPKVGSIVPGVAAGFLYSTDSSLCILEGYVTNPECDSEIRNKALEVVTEHLLAIAEAKGFTYIVAFTGDESIVKRAERSGFENKAKKIMMFKELR